MTKQRVITPILLAVLLSGCSLTPNYERPEIATPASWSDIEASASQPTKIAKDWWTNFKSPELNKLMEQALVSNNDIGAAIHRIEQARGTLRSTSSSLLPDIDGSADITRENINPGSGRSTSDTGATAGVDISYELDLFGGNRAEIESDEFDVQSTQYARDALALVVMGDVAKTYFNVLNLQERLIIADQNLASANDLLRIVQARFDAGATTLLDVSQQKSDLATSEATRAAIENQLDIAKSSLAVLVGIPPQNLEITGKDLRSLPVPNISPGQPSYLIERRPDLRQSEANLQAANADIGAARAAFFPTLTLGAGASIGATPLGDPATTMLSLGSSLLAPIFKGGLLQGNLDRVNARKLELVENYRKTILVSFKEVEDSLSTVKASNTREASLERAMNEARKAYDLSQQQYDAGAIDFQILLDARRTKLIAEDNYIQTKNERLAAAVDLFKALGGGWYDGGDITPFPDSAPSVSPAAEAAPATTSTTMSTTTTTTTTTAPVAIAPAPIVSSQPRDAVSKPIPDDAPARAPGIIKIPMKSTAQ